MKINKDSLKARTNNIANALGISKNLVYDRFFFDAFLTRLATSPYKDKFVLKGGVLLSSVLGLNNRATMDIDFYIKKLNLEKENIVKVIKEICEINIDDGISFEVAFSSKIRLNQLYGGFRVKLEARLENVKHRFGVDIVAGDSIIPSERSYNYECLISREVLPIKAYSLESVVAEKIETIISRKGANSRSKDFYDLYILRKTQLININKNYLKEAFKSTCEKRGLYSTKKETLLLIKAIEKDPDLINFWNKFVAKNSYVKMIKFDEAISAIIEWIDDVY